MQRRPVRHLELTELGFGAAQLGNLFEAISDDDATATVEAAWDAGIRYFDTAPHYGLGLSERRLGAALRDRPRDEFVVSTKVGRLLVDDPDGAGRLDDADFIVPATLRREWDFSRDGILRSVEQSLRRTGLDRFDILYLHDPDDHWEQASTEGVGALVELRDQGVVGAIGAGMNQAAMLAEFVRRCDIDVVMCAGRYTLLDREAEDELLPAAAERGVAVVAAAVYNSGLLSRPEVSDDATLDYRQAPADVIATARRMARIATASGVTLPDLAVRFPLRRPEVASVVVGMRTAEHVRSNAGHYEAAVPDEVWEAVERARGTNEEEQA